MTGRYGIRTRLRADGPPRGTWYGITKWEYTMSEMLSDAGYTTGLFGKWHLGDTEGRFPYRPGVSTSGSESRDRPTAHSGPTATVTTRMLIPMLYLLASCRRSAQKLRRSMRSSDARSAKRWTGRSRTTRLISSSAKPRATSRSSYFLSYTQTHEPVDPHPDYYGKTGHGSFADVLAQTDDYVGELLEDRRRTRSERTTRYSSLRPTTDAKAFHARSALPGRGVAACSRRGKVRCVCRS